MRLETFSRRSRRAGLTLIEVVAAVAILGVILVGTVLANARHTRQLALAEQRSAAIRATDALLMQWWSSPDGIPVNERGAVADSDGLTWRTSVVADRAIEQLEAQVVQVAIHQSGEAMMRLGLAAGEPLLIVEVILPKPPADQAEAGVMEQP